MKSKNKLNKLIDLTSTSMSLLLGVYITLIIISFESFFNIVLLLQIVATNISYALLIRHIKKLELL